MMSLNVLDANSMDMSEIDEVAIKEEKKRLRSEIKEKFKTKQSIDIMKAVSSLQEDASYCKSFLEGLSSYKSAKTVFGYVSTDVEFPTMPLLVQIIKDGKTLVIPRVDGKNLQFCQVHLKDGMLSPLQKGAFNIMEPCEEAPILFPQTKEKLRELLPLIVLVPARAFSPKGKRLGYGGGFYDRFFHSLFSYCDSSLVSLIGLCFSFQLFPDIPLGKYDVLVNEVITE